MSKFRNRWVALSFVIVVLLPSLLVAFYYAFVASAQYVSTAQFAVRGVSDNQLSFLSVSTVFGSSAQTYDSYIIVDYIQSTQLIQDISEEGIDLRKFYSGDYVDVVERIPADLPLELFVDYWKRKVDVSFNSTTGNVLFRVRAFSADDAQAIAAAVMKVSEHLVSQLSANARKQVISAAQEEVQDAEKRLVAVRKEFAEFRAKEQAVDVDQIAVVERTIISELETRLTELQTRRRSISGALSEDAPSLKVLDLQIAAVEDQLAERRARIGAGSSSSTALPAGSDPNLSNVVSKFRDLSMRQEYAETAYTRALGTLETAVHEARSHDRYFAVFDEPRRPEVSTEPKRIFYSLLFIAGFIIVWAIGALLIRAVGEHNL